MNDPSKRVHPLDRNPDNNPDRDPYNLLCGNAVYDIMFRFLVSLPTESIKVGVQAFLCGK